MISSTFKIPKKEAISRDRIHAVQETDDANVKSTYETAQVAQADQDSRLAAPSATEALTDRERSIQNAK